METKKRKIVFKIFELYNKQVHGNIVEPNVNFLPVMTAENKPMEFDTYPEAEEFIDNYYEHSKADDRRELQIEKIYKRERLA